MLIWFFSSIILEKGESFKYALTQLFESIKTSPKEFDKIQNPKLVSLI